MGVQSLTDLMAVVNLAWSWLGRRRHFRIIYVEYFIDNESYVCFVVVLWVL